MFADKQVGDVVVYGINSRAVPFASSTPSRKAFQACSSLLLGGLEAAVGKLHVRVFLFCERNDVIELVEVK